MQFTKQHCLPELMNSPDLSGDRATIAYICYYNGMSLLQEGADPKEPDLLQGYLAKKKHLIDHPFPKNHSDCPQSL